MPCSKGVDLGGDRGGGRAGASDHRRARGCEPGRATPERPAPAGAGGPGSDRTALDEDAELSVKSHELSGLRASLPALAAEIATPLVAEASEPKTRPIRYVGHRLGDQGLSVLEQLPTETLPLGRIYTLARRSDTPVMADEQLAWLFSASGPQRTVAELAPLFEKIEDAPARIDLWDHRRQHGFAANDGCTDAGRPAGRGAARPKHPYPGSRAEPLPTEESPRSRRRQQPSHGAAAGPIGACAFQSAPRGGIGTAFRSHQGRLWWGLPAARDRGARAEETATWAAPEDREHGPPGRICPRRRGRLDTLLTLELGLGPEHVTGVSGTGALALPAKASSSTSRSMSTGSRSAMDGPVQAPR